MPLLSPEMANKVCFSLHKTIYPFQKDMYMGLNSKSITLPSSGEMFPGTFIEPEGCVYLKIGASPVETPLNDPGKFPDRLFRVRSFSHNKDLKGSTETRCKGMFFLEELENKLIFGPNYEELMRMLDNFRKAKKSQIEEFKSISNFLKNRDKSFMFKSEKDVRNALTKSRRVHVADKVNLYLGKDKYYFHKDKYYFNTVRNALEAEIVKDLISEESYYFQTILFKEIFGE